MKTSVFLSTILSFVLLLFLAGFTLNRERSAAGGDEVIDVSPFTKISIAIPANVTIEQGDPQKLAISANDADLEKIETKVSDGRLYIGLVSPVKHLKGDVSVNVTVPELSRISVAGSATVNVPSSFRADDMALRISGSGTIRFTDLSSAELDSKISGSGKLIVSGKADGFTSYIAGSGDVDAFDLEAGDFSGKISGSGECRVKVTGELEASIAGSGTVLYKGNPQVNSTIVGSGRVKRAN